MAEVVKGSLVEQLEVQRDNRSAAVHSSLQVEVVKDRHLLIIDDNVDHLAIYKIMLELHGFSVETTSSLKEAERLLTQEQFDGVLCDLRMPGKGGVDFWKELKTRRGLIVPRFYFFTAGLDEAVVGLEGEALELIPKTATPDYLVEKLRGGRP
ncbi:MAG: response regulator [bacterium]|nr:response regulator [bacterium]